jgi:putative DNA primase/helicase
MDVDQSNPPLTDLQRAELYRKLALLDPVALAQTIPHEAARLNVPVSALRASIKAAQKALHPQQRKPDIPDIGLITEGAVADAFIAKHGEDLRYDHEACAWYLWDGIRWTTDKTKLAFRWAHDLARRLGTDSSDNKVAITAGKAAFAAGVERIAQTDRAVKVLTDQWDRDLWLAGTPDGTLDLRTGEVRESRREDYITRSLGVSPAPAGTPHPIWTKYLDEATGGDKALQTALQRLIGYGLTGEVNEEIVAFLYGVGGSGKGTFLRTIVALFADYVVAVPIEVFTAYSSLNLEYYRAKMVGARLVTSSETEQGKMWAEAQLKEMTGNEAPLSARHPYGKPFSFSPQFLIILVGNHAPKLKGKSRAMERRLRIMPFNRLPAVENNRLKDELRAEYPAILRWAVDGCLAWQKDGLGTAEAVVAETNRYFETQDSFGSWVDDRCITDPDLEIKSSILLANYNSWARANTETEMNANDFAEMLDRTPGVSRVKTHGTRRVRGIGLRATPEENPWENQ